MNSCNKYKYVNSLSAAAATRKRAMSQRVHSFSHHDELQTWGAHSTDGWPASRLAIIIEIETAFPHRVRCANAFRRHTVLVKHKIIAIYRFALFIMIWRISSLVGCVWPNRRANTSARPSPNVAELARLPLITIFQMYINIRIYIYMIRSITEPKAEVAMTHNCIVTSRTSLRNHTPWWILCIYIDIVSCPY